MINVKKRSILWYALKCSLKCITLFISLILTGVFILVSPSDISCLSELSFGIKVGVILLIYFIIFSVVCIFVYIYFWIATKTENNVLKKNEIIEAVNRIDRKSRQGYYASRQIEYIENAERKVRLIIHSLNDENDKTMYKMVDEALRTACLDNGKDVRVLAPFDFNCSRGAYQISEYHSVPIKFSSRMNKGSLRFTMADDHKIIFSVQDPKNPKLSRQHVEIDSYELGRALNRYFDDIWNNNSLNFDGFVNVCLDQNYGKAVDYKIAQEELGIPEETLKRIAKNKKHGSKEQREFVFKRRRYSRMNIISVFSKVLVENRHLRGKSK